MEKGRIELTISIRQLNLGGNNEQKSKMFIYFGTHKFLKWDFWTPSHLEWKMTRRRMIPLGVGRGGGGGVIFIQKTEGPFLF